MEQLWKVVKETTKNSLCLSLCVCLLCLVCAMLHDIDRLRRLVILSYFFLTLRYVVLYSSTFFVIIFSFRNQKGDFL